MYTSNEAIKAIVKYLRELSIIVAGIAVTIGSGFWINSHNNRNDQKQYLDAIQMELEDNAQKFDEYAKWLQKPFRYMDYIRLTDVQSINTDTLNFFVVTDSDGCGIFFVESVVAKFPTNAFEMFKFSGAMRQIERKELLQSIWEAYTLIETSKLNLDRFFQLKQEETMKFVQLNLDGKADDVIPMEAFHTSGIPYEMVRNCEQTSAAIKETLSKFK